MNRLEIITIILYLIKELKKTGSWCGETHVQKTTYFAQGLINLKSNFDFILYKHGPYSFDLHDELMALQAINYLNIIPHDPYGPSIEVSNIGSSFLEKYQSEFKGFDQIKTDILKITSQFGEKKVAELERLATAFYISTDDNWVSDADTRANKIHNIKPHINKEQALLAIDTIENIRSSFLPVD